MRIGYSFYGFLGDYKLGPGGEELSTPDGNATYSWSIIWEAQRRGHTVYSMQEDRDWYAFHRFGAANFAAFSKNKRTSAYSNLKQTHGTSLPDLDVLLLEWRFPIPGRNCEVGKDLLNGEPFLAIHPEHQQDLGRQIQLINHYKQTNTKIIIWDLDHKLFEGDEIHVKPDAIFETSVVPLEYTMKRTIVEPPTIISDLLEHPTVIPDVNRKLVYIGSRYERDDVITEWIKPASDKYPGSVEFHGNWLKSINECKKLWPNISYHDRCTTKDFRRIYSTAAACPLLAKRSYLESGFITPRVWEALMFGTIPIGLSSANGISKYVELVAEDAEELCDFAHTLSQEHHSHVRHSIRKSNVERLEFMDAKYFVNKIEEVV